MPEVTPRLGLKKPYGYETVKRQNFNDNWDALEEKTALTTEATTHKNMNPIDHPDGSVTDDKIGERTPDQAQVPVSPGTGKITQIFSWLANRIKAITGKTNWWDAPSVSLENASNHMGSTNAHSATAEATADRIMMRDANGRAKVAAPSAAEDIARKGDVDTVQQDLNTHKNNTNNPHSTTATQVGAPTSIDGVSNPGGNIDLVAGTGITITPDDPANKITITATGGGAPSPHASTHASDGSDPVSPASIGAETPTGAQAKVDNHANQTAAHGSTSAATANRIVLRDASGRAQISNPSAASDIANKSYVDDKFYKLFRYDTFFESLDGFSTDVNGTYELITGSLQSFHLSITTPATSGTRASVLRQRGYNATNLTWSKKQRMQAQFMIRTSTNQTAYLTIGMSSAYMGFKVVNDALYGCAYNDSEGTVNLSVTLAEWQFYELEAYTDGGTAYFYVDGVYKGSLSTNVPTSGTVIAMMWLDIVTNEDVSKKISMNYFRYFQEG